MNRRHLVRARRTTEVSGLTNWSSFSRVSGEFIFLHMCTSSISVELAYWNLRTICFLDTRLDLATFGGFRTWHTKMEEVCKELRHYLANMSWRHCSFQEPFSCRISSFFASVEFLCFSSKFLSDNLHRLDLLQSGQLIRCGKVCKTNIICECIHDSLVRLQELESEWWQSQYSSVSTTTSL